VALVVVVVVVVDRACGFHAREIRGSLVGSSEQYGVEAFPTSAGGLVRSTTWRSVSRCSSKGSGIAPFTPAITPALGHGERGKNVVLDRQRTPSEMGQQNTSVST